MWMTDPKSDARKAIEQFQKYMRSRNPADAPFLFDNPRPPLSREASEGAFAFGLFLVRTIEHFDSRYVAETCRSWIGGPLTRPVSARLSGSMRASFSCY
jgi:hypothetical protein